MTGEAEKRLVAQLLTLMDGIEPRQNLVVDRRDQPARSDRRGAAPPRPLRPRDRRRRARRAGPARDPRHPHPRHAAGGGRRSRRPRAADLRLRRRRPRGARRARRRWRRCGGSCPSSTSREDVIPTEVLDALSVERNDFDNALKRVQPSAMREVMVEAPTIGWDDIGGLDDAARPAEAKASSCPLQASRRVPPARHPPGQGLPALWTARHRQDPARQGGRRARRRPISSPPSRPTCSPNGTARANSRSRGCSPARARWRRPSSSSTSSTAWCRRAAAGWASRR